MFQIRKPLIAAAVSMALGLGTAATAHADALLFQTNDADGLLEVGAFDWSFTTFLAQGANTAIAAFTAGVCVTAPAACAFNVLTQASLTGYADANGDQILGITGLNNRYQVTMLAKFTETVVGVGVNGLGQPTATFATVAAVPGIVEIYYDRLDAGGTAASTTTGFGFNDGRLILTATKIDTATGSFTIESPVPVALDQNGSDQYPGQFTLPGRGDNGNLNVGDITQDGTFFKNTIVDFGLSFSNISQTLPFLSVNPMDCFTNVILNTTVTTSNAAYACDTVHVSGPYSSQAAGDAAGYVPVTGAINGLAGAPGSPDFVAQTDFNSSFNAIPEPGSLALLGLGLGALGFGARRRRSKDA